METIALFYRYVYINHRFQTVYLFTSRLSQVEYSRTSLIRTPKGQSEVSVLERCPYEGVFMTPKGQSEVSVLERCPYEGVFMTPKGQSEVSVLERCPYEGVFMTPKGQSEVSVLERCPYKRGHHDDVTFMTPLTVLSVQ